ncbi:hypothetical protein CBS101457_004310 [Exobasidium rhododendri]|nr:hypothetical protein CBS101457_004310 [Exobasidium rhododendri]
MTSHTVEKELESGDTMASQLTSPTALRKLVLNYLVHHCYTDTAQAFAHDGSSTFSSRGGLDASASESASLKPSSTSAAPQIRQPRLTHQHLLGSAHPLSAPPLSREDSNMEIEVDSLLSLAGGRGLNGSRDDTTGIRHGNGLEHDTAMDGLEDAQMGESSQVRELDMPHNDVLDSEELSADELQSVRIRGDIKDHILNGRIKLAIDLCNLHFPTVLNAESTISTIAGKEAEHVGIAKQTNLQGKEKSTKNSEVVRVLPAHPTSLLGPHLSLNLQIQAFIESVRAASTSPHIPSNNNSNNINSSSHTSLSAAANSAGPKITPTHPFPNSTPGITSAMSRSASPAPSSASSNGSATSTNGLGGSAHSNGSAAFTNPVLHAALIHAQSLHTNIQKLPGYWRAMYLKELESVTALLAYTDLERSPVRKFLDQSRRVAIAEQINSAIMFRTGKPSQPLIESAVRQTSYLWSTLSSEKIVVPNDHAIFTTGTVIGIDKFESQTATSTGAERTKTKGKVRLV